ncbi:MAG: HlyD family secretion protein [Patescibacteria group bacterium]|nr:HlyD family secretion protein [Patescibacteria group bacterium]
MKKQTLAILASVIVLAGAGYSYSKSKTASTASVRVTEKDTVAAFSGTVRSTIQGVGTATASSTQSLQFNSNGKIVAWNVSAGDRVKKGQILAEVDSRDVDNDIRNQTLSLKNAQLSYDKLFTSVKDYQIAQMEANIASSERTVASAPKEIENLEMERDAKLNDQRSAIAATERSVAIAKEKLATLESDISYTVASSENTVNKSGTDLAYILSTASVNAGNQLSDSRAFVQDLETSALNYANDNAVPSEFAAKDGAKGIRATNAFVAFRGLLPAYASDLSSADFTSTGGVLAFLAKRESLANSGLAAADALSQALDASLAAGTMSQSVIDSLLSTVSSARSKFASAIGDVASVRKQIASIDDPSLVRQSADNSVANKRSSMLDQKSSLASLEATLASQKFALTKLESDYAIKIQQKVDSVANTEASLRTSRLNLADLKDGPTDEEIASAKNQIEQAAVSLAKVKKKKEDYQIIASFDGIVTASNGKVGEISTNSNSSSTASATSVTVEIPGLYEISVLVDQLDVVKIKAGQASTIKFDSYSERSFTGTVSEVDPTPVTSQGVVSYKAKILFQSDELRLYNSMTATVTIVTEERSGVVLVPTSAISQTDGKKTVRVWTNGRSKTVEVKAGLTEGANTEILSGVNVGDKVVTTAFAITTKTGSSGFSLFGAGRRSSGASSGSSSSSPPSSSSARPSGSDSGPPPGM